jgi:hypothetical protein
MAIFLSPFWFTSKFLSSFVLTRSAGGLAEAGQAKKNQYCQNCDQDVHHDVLSRPYCQPCSIQRCSAGPLVILIRSIAFPLDTWRNAHAVPKLR